MGKWEIVLASIVLFCTASAQAWISDRKIGEDYSAILKIDRKATVLIGYGEMMCTGTFLSPNFLVTAVHCLKKGDPTGGINVDGIKSLAAYQSDKFYPVDSQGSTIKYDVAFVAFPEGTGDFLGITSYPVLATKAAGPDDTVYMVGFGMNNPRAAFDGHSREADGAGLKGWAPTSVEDATGGVITTKLTRFPTDKEEKPKEGEVTYSQVLQGDSGGALYNTAGEIVGIASADYTQNEYEQTAKGLWALFSAPALKAWSVKSKFVDIQSEDSLRLLGEALMAERARSEAEKEAIHPVLAIFGSGEPDPFAAVSLMTGFYQQEAGQRKIFLGTRYDNDRLTMVFSTEIDGTADPKVTMFVCDGEIACISLERNKMMIPGKGRFIQFDMKLGDDPLKAEATNMTQFIRE